MDLAEGRLLASIHNRRNRVVACDRPGWIFLAAVSLGDAPQRDHDLAPILGRWSIRPLGGLQRSCSPDPWPGLWIGVAIQTPVTAAQSLQPRRLTNA